MITQKFLDECEKHITMGIPNKIDPNGMLRMVGICRAALKWRKYLDIPISHEGEIVMAILEGRGPKSI